MREDGFALSARVEKSKIHPMEHRTHPVHNENSNEGTTYWTQDKICDELSELCSKISASDKVTEIAKSICRQAFDLGLKRQRYMRSFIAASLFMALRENGETVTIRDFFAKLNANPQKRQQIVRYYRTLFDGLNPMLPVVDSSCLVQVMGERTHRSAGTVDLSLRLLNEAKQTSPEITGRIPTAVAAAAVYMASRETGEWITEKELAEAAGVAEQCVRNSVKAFKNLRGKPSRVPNKIATTKKMEE